MKHKKQLANDKEHSNNRAASNAIATAKPAAGVVMTKLKTGKPGDRYEIEAERVAGLVMQSGAKHTTFENDVEKARQKPITPWIAQISSRPASQSAGGDYSPSSSWLESHLSRSKGNGKPMPEVTKSFMENRFGADFGQVNIHTGTQATMLSKSLNAQAFTHGNDIYFDQGKYSPDSSTGKHLLAHELTHVLQQGEMSTTQTFLQKFEQPQSFDIRLNVPMIYQEKQASCWHAAARMLWAYRNRQSIHPLPADYDADLGLQPNDFSRLALTLGLYAVPFIPAYFTARNIADLLQNYGPLWVAGEWYGFPHIIVVTGANSNGSIFVNDPDTGPRQHDILWFNAKIHSHLAIPMMWLP